MTPEDSNQIFPLGGDASGEHALNLNTGEVISTEPRPAPATRTIAAPDICPASLRETFTEAGYDTHYDDDGDLVVSHAAGKINIVVDPRFQYLGFLAAFVVNEFAGMDLKHELANGLNDRYHLVRFYFPDATTLVADYVMSYKHGVTTAELTHMLERFAQATDRALSNCDELGLIL